MDVGYIPYLPDKGMSGRDSVRDYPDRGPRDDVVMVVMVVSDVLR